MRNVMYDYSSIHVDVPMLLANEIIQWGKDQVSDDDIYVTQRDPTFGREDEIHITILYGIHTESSEAIRPFLNETQPLKVRLGKIDIFTNPHKFDVVMIEVISDDLRQLNEKLHHKIRYTNKYGKYNPHVTIAYVKKGKGWRHCGNSLWEGKEFTCRNIIFSSKNGIKESVAL